MDLKRKYITGQYHAAFDLNRKDGVIVEDSHKVFIWRDSDATARSLLIDINEPGLFISSEFEWGNRSKGTKQLATSILLEFTNHFETARFMDLLVDECLALIPAHRDFQMQMYALERWLKSKRGQPDLETDLMLWTNIEHLRPPKPVTPVKKPLIIPPPPIADFANTVLSKSVIRRLESQKGGNIVSLKQGRSTKYPTGTLEVGQFYYFINPSKHERKNVFGAAAVFGTNNDREYLCKSVTAQWAREHNIDVAQDSAEVCIVLRTA